MILTLTPQNIPEALTSRPQWVLWRMEEREGKPTKVPYDVHTAESHTRRKAACDNPATWGDFPGVLAAYQKSQANGRFFSGIGYQLAAEDPICGIDLDKCLDPDTGEVQDWALDIIHRLHSYTERSPSGTGLRIFCRGQLPPGRRRKGQVEMYQEGRFLTCTGSHFGDTPRTVEERSDEIKALHGELFPEPQAKASERTSSTAFLTDGEVLDLCRRASNSGKFDALYRGSADAYGGDESAADAALCSILAFYTQDAGQIERIFSGSGLCRDKWRERADYRERTIRLALSGLRETYSPPGVEYQEKHQGSHRNGTGSHTTGSHTNGRGPAVDETPTAPAETEWPEAAPEMFYGLAGEIVRTIEPHTEADPVALLVQLLAAFGSAIGRSAHFKAEADQHFGNLFVVMVGVSSKGRKGTSWGHVRRLLALADPQWEGFCVQTGLSSGEGLIWHVRDAVEKPVKNKTTGEVELEPVDPGVTDKRMLVMENEYASVLRVASRDGNTLSAVVRDAWDRGRLQTMTKNNAAKATGAHVSLIGHVTDDELRRELSSTEAGNGFANRFLWICARRSKELPEGGQLQDEDLVPLSVRLAEAIDAGRQAGLLVRDEHARKLWHDVYHDLSEGGPGLSGAVTSRGEAQTMRLALLYALLDGADSIQQPHLTAALALWEYVEASARYVFGNSLGDPVADDILRALRNTPDGLSRTDLQNLLGRHQASNRIGQALALLLKHGRARVVQEQTGGRPTERWFVAAKKSDDGTA